MSTEAKSQYGKFWNPNTYYKNTDIAEDYDKRRFKSLAGRVFNGLERRAVRAALAGLPKDALVLDAPCGTGRMAEVLLEEGYRVVGFDVSDEMLAVAKKRLARFGDRFQTETGDIRSLGDGGRRFDAAMCIRFLMHFPLEDQKAFLGAVAAASKGPVVFNQSTNTPYQRLRRRVKRLLGHLQPVSFPLTPGEADALIRAAGLDLKSKTHLAPPVSEAVVFVCETPAD